MDLRLRGVTPTDEERAAVDALLGAPASSWEVNDPDAERLQRDLHVARGGHAQRGRRHLLLPALHAVHDRVGWISEGALDYVCARLDVPPADAWGVVTFYALFATAPRPRRVVHVCDDIACRCSGADELAAACERQLGAAWHPPTGDSTTHDPDALVWMRSPCLGLCDQAPAILSVEAGDPSREQLVGHASLVAIAALQGGPGALYTADLELPQRGAPGLALLARVGVVDPESIGAYRASGGYEALRRAFELGPEGVLREVADSALIGRGGAAFPTGRKWEAVARAPARPHYLVCNADESEPGTFKDRVLLEGDPFALVEAMTIAAYATGCEQGFIYIRGEYPLAVRRIRRAIEAATTHGLLGEDIMGRGLTVRLEVRKGAGAYICGEETALFNSIEGLRGEPRSKPPFPVQAGLFGKPTVVNNVETLYNVPLILAGSGAGFAKTGTAQSTGTKLYCLSGCVRRPGVYEAPFGISLRDLIALGGGARDGRRITAVLLGGAAGVFVRGDELDIPLSVEGARAAGATIGSGVVMVFDDAIALEPIVHRIAAFFRDESCGQCVPCRVGTVRQEEALHRLARGATNGSREAELALLADVGIAMRDASICGLGQTAYAAVESAITRLRLYEEPR
ncbi:MAG TPA: NAD(P)H-dependent oxidoreductase subunit E [Gemmatimonadaceae bacterium]|nr:NAD(P)H-dependent oxidoreductase subunit E [Gemmatimonadaceae bacterium]